MATPLDDMLRTYVTPVARAAGWRKTGKTYRLDGTERDQAVIDFQCTATGPGETTFFLNVAVVPRSKFDFSVQVLAPGPLAPKNPGEQHGLWRDRVFPPEHLE